MDDSGDSLSMAPACLDNIEFWAPSAKGAGWASPPKQRYGPSSPPSPVSSSFPTDRGLAFPRSTVRGQTLDRPISIPSDIESDIDTTDGSDVEQNDAGRSDSSLASINTLLAQAKSHRSNATRRASLDSLFEDPDSMRPPASPAYSQTSHKTGTNGESLGSSSLSSAVPSTPQEHDAEGSCDARSSLGSDSLDRSSGNAPASSSCAEAPEASSPLPSSSSAPERQGIEMATGTSCETEAPSPKHALGTPPRKSKRPRRTSQRRVKSISGYANPNPDATSDSDSGDETSASTGSHDKTRSDDESYPSPGRGEGGQGAGDGVDDEADDESDDESDSSPPKRRKLSKLSASIKRKRGWGLPSVGADAVNSLARAETSRSACVVPSPPSSHCSSQSSPPSITGAKFEEWPLPNATLKRITLGDGQATFQLQSDWDPREDSRQVDSPSNGLRAPTSRKGVRPRGDAASSAAYTPAENEFIISLKEGHGGRNWATIHREFNEKFPGRTKGSLQVHYCTKLKDRTAS